MVRKDRSSILNKAYKHENSARILPKLFPKFTDTNAVYDAANPHNTVTISQIIEKLATVFPQPIKFESRRRSIQQFLVLSKLSIKLIWFPIMKKLVKTYKLKKRETTYICY